MTKVIAYENTFRVLVHGPISAIEMTDPTPSSAVGLAQGFNSALALGRVQKRLVGVATETDAAIRPSAAAGGGAGIAAETDTPLALVRLQKQVVGLATTTNTAFALPGPTTTADSSLTPPTLSLASAANAYPPSINFDFNDANVQAGDRLAVRKSSSYPVTSSDTTARITLTDAMIASGTFSFASNSDVPTFLSSISSPAQTFFQAFIERGTSYGPSSNTIKHGDVTAPTLTTSSPTTIAEGGLVLANLAFSEPVTVVSFTGLDGSLLKDLFPGADTNKNPALANGQLFDYETKSSYSYTINVIDLAGNPASFNVVSNLTDIDEVPDAFSFTDQLSASTNTQYESNTITISGLGSGVNAPFTVSGSGEYRKNGGTYQAAGSGTVTNGDTMQLRGTSGSSAGASVGITLNVGGVSDTFTIQVPATKYRYMRLRIDDTADGGNYAGMSGLQVSAAAGTADLSSTATKTASTTAFGGVVGNLFDGNTATYWHSDSSGFPQWILLDWGTNSANHQAIGAVRLTTRSDGNSWYQMPTIATVEQSNDLSSWVTKFNISANWETAGLGETREFS